MTLFQNTRANNVNSKKSGNLLFARVSRLPSGNWPHPHHPRSGLLRKVAASFLTATAEPNSSAAGFIGMPARQVRVPVPLCPAVLDVSEWRWRLLTARGTGPVGSGAGTQKARSEERRVGKE